MSIVIPKRAWPPHDGNKAFTDAEEAVIYDAIKVHKIHPTTVAAKSKASLPTIYKILKRENARRAGTQPGGDQGRAETTPTGPINGDCSTNASVLPCATAC